MKSQSIFPMILLSFAVVCLLLVGCGAGGIAPKYESNSQRSYESDATPASADAEYLPSDNDVLVALVDESKSMQKSGEAAPAKRTLTRKIIYNANVRLVVAEFDPVEDSIRELVVAHDGFLAKSDVDAQRGEHRSGNWTVRVPVENYHTFLNELGQLGSTTSRSENAQDVTEEFVDLSARISNKKKLEERIIELLKNRDDKIQDVLAVEQELGRVREEIERMQGRMKYLSDRSSLATIDINVVQERDYKPVEALTFSERISETWSDSTESLLSFGRSLLVFIVGIAPWLIAFLIIAVPAIYILRACFRRLFRTSVTVADRV